MNNPDFSATNPAVVDPIAVSQQDISGEYQRFLMRFVEEHPIPQLQNPDTSEVFGPLLFEGEAFFRRYDALSRCWSIVLALNPGREPKIASPSDNPDHIAAYNTLLLLPTPDEPGTKARGGFETWFYEGRRFAWIYSPGMAGWSLAVQVNIDDGRSL